MNGVEPGRAVRLIGRIPKSPDGVFYVHCLVFLTGALGMLAQSLQAKIFGLSEDVSFLLSCQALPSLLAGSSQATIPALFVPLLSPLPEKARKELEARLICFALIAGLIVSVAGCMAAIYSAPFFGGPSSAPLVKSLVPLEVALWVSAGTSVVSSSFGTLRQVRGEPARICAAAAAVPIGAILGLLTLHSAWGTMSIALGSVIGSLFQLTLVFRHVERAQLRMPDRELLQAILSRAPLVVCSLLPFTSAALVMAYWSARTHGSSLQSLGYCNSITTAITVVIGAAIVLVRLPLYSRTLQTKGAVKDGAFAATQLEAVFAISIVVSTVIASARRPLVTMYLRHGAYGDSAITALAALLPAFMVVAVCYSAANVTRALSYTEDEYRKTALLGLLIPALFFGLAGVLSGKFGPNGIAYSYAGSAVAYVVSAVLWSNTYGRMRSKLRLLSRIAVQGGCGVAVFQGCEWLGVEKAIATPFPAALLLAVLAGAGISVLVYSLKYFFAFQGKRSLLQEAYD